MSINHNWCNAVNLSSLYAAMCDKVAEVEAALEDVRELLSRGRADPGAGVANASDGQDWRREWTSIVQDVVEKDAGWKCVLCSMAPGTALILPPIDSVG